MAFNAEDKITLEELSPSLQNLIKTAASKTELEALNNRTNNLVDLFTDLKFEVVDSLDNVRLPQNGKNMAVCVTPITNDYYLYIYYNNQWNKIPTTAMDLNQEFIIDIVQSAHQTITAKYNNRFYTDSFKAKINSEVEVSIIAEDGYTVGKISSPEVFPVVGPVSISASAATAIPKFTITVSRKAHQTVQVTYNGELYENHNVSNVLSMDTFKVSCIPDDGWIAGDLDVTSNSILLYENNYIITGDTTIIPDNATRKNYVVTIQGTENQDIIFTYRDSNTGVSHTETISTLTTTITLPYESSYTVTAKGKNGYLPGNLSTTSGIIISDLTVSISTAKSTYAKETFDSNGTYTWRVPYYINKVKYKVAGAGGGCHSEEIDGTTVYINGGYGELIEGYATVTPETRYTIKVGKAGTSLVSGGNPSQAFGVTAFGGNFDGTDAGNGKGSRGDIVIYLTGAIEYPAKDGYVIFEYGTKIEREGGS